ncbi:MAG: Crp/Fnr family transcriptional regulator [Bacteroidota bacterium]
MPAPNANPVFHQFVQQFPFFTERSIELLNTHMQEDSFPKSQLIVKEGQVSNRIYLITQGAMRIYFERDGLEKTDWIALEGDLMMAPASFFTQEPSEHLIETIEPTVALSLSYQELNSLYQQDHEIERMGRLITIESYLMMYKHLHLLRTLSAKERYQKLLDTQPHLIQRIPLTYIASFLNMSLETLSRIRGRLI